MGYRSRNIRDCVVVGSVIKFDIPYLGLGFFFSTYRLLIKGVIKNYRKKLEQPKNSLAITNLPTSTIFL
jgi:hypothetical protein